LRWKKTNRQERQGSQVGEKTKKRIREHDLADVRPPENAIEEDIFLGVLGALAVHFFLEEVIVVQRRLRILVAKPGLDGHDRGAKIIARALRDAGFEVIYTGLHQTPEMVAEAALQEDVDAVGLSILSGAHMTLFPAVLDLLKEKGVADIMVFGGGIIPPEDIAELKTQGVKEIFTPGATTQDVVKWVQENVRPRS
jgi:methylmalonyl-CoA mutase C-terminal domain/subunit